METNNTSTALVLLGEDKIRADMFFDRPLIETDWDQVRLDVRDGKLKSVDILAEIKAMEPLQEKDPRDFKHWQLQQKLRIALRFEAGKPLVTNQTCEDCGTRKSDHQQTRNYAVRCLHCAEIHEQVFYGGYRGNCEFLCPKYDPVTHSWGILYYWSHDRDPFMFWLACFFKTRMDAVMALSPFKHYEDYLEVKYKGMFSTWNSFSRMIGIEDALARKLPLNPEEFREVLRSKIEADMAEDHQVMRYYVRDAMNEHKEEERD